MATITFTQANSPVKFDIQATEDGEVLSFRGAVLCRAETNLNRDEIDEQGILELAASLIGRPVDVEHNVDMNCGVFTSAVPTDGGTALAVDGFIWADRYPREADGVRSGTHALSVEATADKAICSVCNQEFAGSDQYCDHLIRRSSYGAVRKLRGLHGKGGAVTTSPAGSNTRFNPTQVYFVASHNEEAGMKKDKKDEAVEVKAAEEPVVEACSPVAEACSPAVAAEVAPVMAEAMPVVAEFPPAKEEPDGDEEDLLAKQVAELAAGVGMLKASVETLQAEVNTLKASQVEEKVMARRLALKASMTDDEWEKEKDTLLGMDHKAFSLFVASKQTNRLTLAAGVRLPEPVAGGTAKEPLTLK